MLLKALCCSAVLFVVLGSLLIPLRRRRGL
jgi:hypothetical protein